MHYECIMRLTDTRGVTQITYITVVDHQVRSMVLVVVLLKKGGVRVRHDAIVKMMGQH
jgi:hypothetical protein